VIESRKRSKPAETAPPINGSPGMRIAHDAAALRHASRTSMEAAVSDHGKIDFRLPCSCFITVMISASPSADTHHSTPIWFILFAIALQEHVGDEVIPSQSLSIDFNSAPGPGRA
jgi:hypothetical protein